MSLARAAARLARYAWAAPCSAVGLVAAALLWAARGRLALRDGTLEASVEGAAPVPWIERLPVRAITFGHVILAASASELECWRAHEQVHVRQYERWGLLFFAAYALSSLAQWLRGRDPYLHNGFEVQARALARR
jgi:hypothetical protein